MNNLSLKTNASSDAWSGPCTDSRIVGWFIATILTNGFGVVSNFIVLLALIVYKPLRRSSSSLLIIHCIVIDLYATAIAVPIDTIPLYLGPTWPLPPTFCKYQGLYLYITYAASQYASAVLAFHRLTAVICPLKFKIFTKRSAIVIMILTPWVISAIINIFPTAEVGLKVVPFKTYGLGGCTFALTPNTTIPKPFLLYTTASYYIPTFFMGICYSTVLLKTQREIRLKGQTASVALRRRFEISRTLFVSFLWLCASVYPINLVASFASRRFAADLSLMLFLRWLSTSFGCMNPIFFWTTSKLFQAGIGTVMKCQWFRRLRKGNITMPCSVTISKARDPDRLTFSKY
ncbi:hypothetical protein BV898_15322 [Hypsibius exemplaris]|uniref:G-protein coupled receptors family 1 profile domain-containing protein n=1 Tax=Hypsibius exemplaris TaxID=2072580 RepID=A0A9X6NHL8_HYPEX|nr:hypothetical protein BV898_15322 [Hypsibius exemplaris]